MNEIQDYYYGESKGEIRKQAIHLHHQRYEELGYFEKGEIDPYEDISTYIAVQDKSNAIVGVTRLIHAKLEELPTIKYFEVYDLELAKLKALDQSQVAELSAFTRQPGHDIGVSLLKNVMQYSLINGITHWVCCIDERVYKYAHRIMKFPFKVIGQQQIYLGSVTIPCTIYLPEFLSTMQERRPTLYEYFISKQGSIIEGIPESISKRLTL